MLYGDKIMPINLLVGARNWKKRLLQLRGMRVSQIDSERVYMYIPTKGSTSSSTAYKTIFSTYHRACVYKYIHCAKAVAKDNHLDALYIMYMELKFFLFFFFFSLLFHAPKGEGSYFNEPFIKTIGFLY